MSRRMKGRNDPQLKLISFTIVLVLLCLPNEITNPDTVFVNERSLRGVDSRNKSKTHLIGLEMPLLEDFHTLETNNKNNLPTRIV